MDQVAWMVMANHPDDLSTIAVDEDLGAALDFECSNEASGIDNFGANRLKDLVTQAEALEPKRAAWVAGAPLALRPLVAMIHGPLVEFLIQVCDYEDKGLLDCLQAGFPFAGPLPASGVAVRPGIPHAVGHWTVQQLRKGAKC